MDSRIQAALDMLTKGQRTALGNIAELTFGIAADDTVMVKQICPRCGGSGSYSFCQMHGTRCFQCDVASGGKQIGYIWKPLVKVAKQMQRQAAQLRKHEEYRKAVETEAEMLKSTGFVSLSDFRSSGYTLLEKLQAEANQAQAANNAELIAMLKQCKSGEFVKNIITQLENGYNPSAFSPKCKDILVDIIARTSGRRGSKAYNATSDIVSGLLG